MLKKIIALDSTENLSLETLNSGPVSIKYTLETDEGKDLLPTSQPQAVVEFRLANSVGLAGMAILSNLGEGILDNLREIFSDSKFISTNFHQELITYLEKTKDSSKKEVFLKAIAARRYPLLDYEGDPATAIAELKTFYPILMQADFNMNQTKISIKKGTLKQLRHTCSATCIIAIRAYFDPVFAFEYNNYSPEDQAGHVVSLMPSRYQDGYELARKKGVDPNTLFVKLGMPTGWDAIDMLNVLRPQVSHDMRYSNFEDIEALVSKRIPFLRGIRQYSGSPNGHSLAVFPSNSVVKQNKAAKKRGDKVIVKVDIYEPGAGTSRLIPITELLRGYQLGKNTFPIEFL